MTLAVISRAPIAEIVAFKKRMGWRFHWVSSFGTDFNYDYHVSFKPEERAQGKVNYNYQLAQFPSEEGPGLSVFCKDANGDIFHTYSSYGSGLDILVGTYNFLDIAPKGRDEAGLAHSMAWVRHHDKYFQGYSVDPTQSYMEPEKVDLVRITGSCCSGDHHE